MGRVGGYINNPAIGFLTRRFSHVQLSEVGKARMQSAD
jgi:hypothetical protein